MISINKQGNAIVIEFTDNDKYLFNGTIEVAPNELMIVIDESNMATFKRSTNGDTLFSQLINKIQIGGINVTKDTILDEFAKIGFTTGSGGSGAVNSVNGQTGDVVLTASNVGAYSKNEVDNLLNSKQDVFQVDAPMSFNGEHLSINLTNYATKADISGKADSSAVEALSTEVTTNSTNITNLTNKVNEESEKIATLNTEIAGKQAKLIAGQNIELSAPDESGNVTISATGEVSVDWSEITGKPTTFSDWNATEGEQVIANKPDLSEYATNSELNHVKSELANKADTSSLNNYATKDEITGLATKEELADYQPVGDYATTTQLNSKQDTLVSGTNIKTINGQSVLGTGDIEISSVVDTEMSDTSENAVQNKVIKQYIDTASSELTSALSSKADSANVYTKAEIDNMIGQISARLDQINGEVI